MMNDEFYIGWEDQAPPRYAQTIRWLLIPGLTLLIVAAAGFARSQRLIGSATFDWGNPREISGFFRSKPYPHLILDPSGTNAPAVVAPLVAPFKSGLNSEAVCGFDGQRVSLRATRIERAGQLMLEVETDSLKRAPSIQFQSAGGPTNVISLGRRTFRGEIVDSKCWTGVMNPGVLTTHRACAIRCISGGIPPMLLVRRENEPPLNLLLVSTNDEPVNSAVLSFVAEPVSIHGELVRHGALLTFRIDPSKISRLSESSRMDAEPMQEP